MNLDGVARGQDYKKNTNSTQNKSQTHRAKQYEVMSFLSTDCELSTDTCSKNVYSLGPRSLFLSPIDRDDRDSTVILDAVGESLFLCRIDRDDREPIVNFDGVARSLFLSRIDRDDSAPNVNREWVVE